MYKRESIAVLDIETNLAHDTIWMAGVYHPLIGVSTSCRTVEELHTALAGVDTIVGHNIISFDLEVLRNVWSFSWNRDVVDTLVMGRLLNPSVDGGHSLRAWAERAGGSLKEDFDAADFDLGLTQKMIDYCLADCRANWDVYQYMLKLKEEDGFSDESLELEHRVATITKIQERNGFAFDFTRAARMYTEHKERMDAIQAELQEVFPPIVEERYSEKTGKRLKDKVTVFNAGSRQQVAARLEAKGAVWKKRTETGLPKVDETTLAELGIPEADLVLEYLTLSKRIGMVRSWLDAVAEDGRIHGRVNTCGAVTGRMTHSSPNLAQIPSESQYRECFTVAEGNKLVGCDASALELRLLAHYMKDDDYIKEVLEGDVHTANQKAFGCETRSQAKVIFYAMIYGAGDAKLGEAVGGNAKAGAKLRDNFMRNLPAFAQLQARVKGIYEKKGSVPSLDGRRLWVRSEHACLNTLLQGAGAVIMKKALVLAVDRLEELGLPYKLVAQVHDEAQLEVPERYATQVGTVFRNSIRRAGECFNLRCPMDGEYMVGDNWSETH